MSLFVVREGSDKKAVVVLAVRVLSKFSFVLCCRRQLSLSAVVKSYFPSTSNHFLKPNPFHFIPRKMLHLPSYPGAAHIAQQRPALQALQDEYYAPDEDVSAFSSALTTHFVGRHILSRDAVDSTMEVANREATEGAPHGTVVVARKQLAGLS